MLSLLFGALAMASKSSTVILPVVLCLCGWWIEGGWHGRNVVRVVPMFLMSAAASALSIWTQGLQLATSTDPQWVRTWPQRLVAAGDAVWFYLGKLLWPDPLITIYPRWQIDAGQWVSYLPLLAVIVLFSILWLKRRDWARACFFALAYFLTALLPVLGLIDTFIFRFSLVFDHFQYLASMGPLALAGAGLARSSDFVLPKRPWLRAAVCAGLLLILGMASWQRTEVFKSEEILWSDTLSKYPDCWVGYNNLGNTLLQNGQLSEAIAKLQRAVQIYPDYAVGHYNLGVVLFREGKFDDALAEFEKAVKLNPNYAEAHTNLGLALVQKGQLDKAIEQYQTAIKINPIFALAHANLGVAFIRLGNIDDGIAQLQEALRLNPNLSGVRDSIAKAKAFELQK